MTRSLVIGGGINGLACALRLAQAGHEVTVLEAAPVMGGLAAAREFHPGYRSPVAHLAPLPDRRLSTGAGGALPTTLLAGAGNLTVDGRATTGPDAAAWAALHDRLSRFAAALAPFRAMTPPRLAPGAETPVFSLARRALSLRAMGTADFREFGRMLLTNLHDVADDHLTDDRLKGLLAFDGTLGAWTGPRAPNSLILYLDRLAQGPVARTGDRIAALAATARSRGVDLRPGTRVERIDVEDDRATGVRLADGTRLRADRVVSTLAPQLTLRRLVGAPFLDAGLYRRLGQLPARGAAAKLHLALDAVPDLGADLGHRLVIAPAAEAVERAWTPVKYGETPVAPAMELVVDTAAAPKGGAVLSALVQFAPHRPKDREAARAALTEAALATLETRAPGLRKAVVAAEMLMPWDIEALTGAPGGAWHHTDLAIERMFFLRPCYDLARYATPVGRLWLAGAGSHPGGGLSGSAGVNAAEAMLQGDAR